MFFRFFSRKRVLMKNSHCLCCYHGNIELTCNAFQGDKEAGRILRRMCWVSRLIERVKGILSWYPDHHEWVQRARNVLRRLYRKYRAIEFEYTSYLDLEIYSV